MSDTRKPAQDHDADRRRAERDLERLGNDGGAFGSPALKGKAKSVRAHFAADDADQTDPVEVAATRTGRILALVAFIALAVWLLSTYAI